MDYTTTAKRLRAERDELERQLRELRADRDREILELRRLGLSYRDIGRAVGVSAGTVAEVVDPDYHARRNDARVKYARDRAARVAA